jgi:hypothetical protein
VKRFRDQCQHHLVLDITSKAELGWTEEHNRSVIDYLNDSNKVTLFISPSLSQNGNRLLKFNLAFVGQILESNNPICFFIKIETTEPLTRPGQFDTVIYQSCLDRGTKDLPGHLAKVVFYFEKQAIALCQDRLKGCSIFLIVKQERYS